MPRPKPPAPIIPRTVRLSDKDWEVFNRLGGAAWLRGALRTAEATAHNVQRRLGEGVAHRAIAKELRISTKTIQVIKTQWFPT